MKVKDIRPYESPRIIKEDAEMETIVEEFIKNPFLHHVCVVDEDGRLLGLINRKRIFKTVFLHHLAPDTRITKLLGLMTAAKSSELMITNPVICKENDDINDVIKKMIDRNIREIPVMDEEGRILGFITILMLLKEWLKGSLE